MNIAMSVLTLAYSGGSNCYIRDVAKYMIGQGHKVAVYSPELGPLADEIRDLGGLVFDVPDFGDFEPDIIHGQHHFDLMPLALRYFHAPIIYFTHGVFPPQEKPPAPLPRVVKHICVSIRCREELLKTRHVPDENLELLFNFVDEDVFDFMPAWQNRAAKPRSGGAISKIVSRFRPVSFEEVRKDVKCLVFGNTKPKEIEELRAACKALDIVLDEVGMWSEAGNQPNPASFLPDYDIVFCYGKSAIEALYSGCDVHLMCYTGTGEVVTNKNFPDIRRRNFGYTVSQGVLGQDGFEESIKKVIKARANGRLLLGVEHRTSLRSQPILERLEDIYKESIDMWDKKKTQFDADELRKLENHALSAYFMELRKMVRFG